MTIYSWVNTARYAGYLGESAADERRLRWYDSVMGDSLPTLELWTPPRLRQYSGEGTSKRKPAPLGDSASSALVNLISQRAADALADVFDRNAVLYPVTLADAGQTYYMVVSKTQLNCLDEERSRGTHLDLGSRIVRFATIDEWVFDEACVGASDLFHSPYSNTTLFVSSRFKDRVVDAGLRGFCLQRRTWEENPFVS
jgi:hypothetical protein